MGRVATAGTVLKHFGIKDQEEGYTYVWRKRTGVVSGFLAMAWVGVVLVILVLYGGSCGFTSSSLFGT
jgi:hypothetical protein